MAKKRVKKATRQPVKAKRSMSARRRTRQLPLFDPKTGEPTRDKPRRRAGKRSEPVVSAAERARGEQRVMESRRNWEESEARRRARLSVRPRADALPKEVERWLLSNLWNMEHDVREELRHGMVDLDFRAVSLIAEVVQKWFVEGCRQGYIEGRVTELVARRETSHKRIRRNREQVIEVENQRLDKDERDAKIFATLPALKHEHGAEAAEMMMAKQFGISDRQVRVIVREQEVLREHAALVRQGSSVAAAEKALIQRHGVNKYGKPSQAAQASVRKILAKGRLRRLPELPEVP